MKEPLCAVCNATTTLQCSRCHQVNYCGRVCQTRHWKNHHRNVCQPAAMTPAMQQLPEGHAYGNGHARDIGNAVNTTAESVCAALCCGYCSRQGMAATGIRCSCQLWYCRRKCKEKHYRGEHRQACAANAEKKIGKSNTRPATELDLNEALNLGMVHQPLVRGPKSGTCPVCYEPYDTSGCHCQKECCSLQQRSACGGITHTELKLPCGHSVCHRCLHGLRTKQSAEMNICCPLCRARIPPSPDELYKMAETCHKERYSDPTQKAKAAELLIRVLEEQRGLGEAWVLLITAGGGMLAGKWYSPADCCAEVMDMSKSGDAEETLVEETDLMHGEAWVSFGLHGGGEYDCGQQDCHGPWASVHRSRLLQ